jgi:hypothetical protein
MAASGDFRDHLWGESHDRRHCDRNTCKLFWSDAGRKLPTLTKGELTRHELQPVVSQTDQQVLQPV